MSRFTSRLGATIAMTAAFGLATATTAVAHECYNASRSDQGNTMAGSKSQAWFTLVVADAIAGDVEDGFLTPEQGECITAAYADSGAPSSFTIKVRAGKDGVIGGSANLGDGKGIDHLFAAYGEQIGGAFAGCGVEF